MDNMIFTSEVCGVVLIAPFDKISRPPCSTIRFIVFLSLFFRCFSPFSFYHRTFSLTTAIDRKQEKPPPVLAIPGAAIEGQMLVGALLPHYSRQEGFLQ